MRFFIKLIIHALLFIPGKLRINPLLNTQAFLQELIQQLIVRIRCEKEMERFIVFPYLPDIHRFLLHKRRIINMPFNILQVILNDRFKAVF